MIKELVKMANHLDTMGLKVEADRIDGIIRRIASSGDSAHREFGNGNYGIYHMSPVGGGVYTVTWFDTLEEAERELASGHYQIDGGGYPYIVTREETKGMMSDDKSVDPFDDESEDPTDWSEPKWKEWNSQAGTFGKNEYTVVKLYKGDGETPVFEAKHEMVGGTQEDPELEWVKKEIIIPVKGGIGDRFDIKEGLSSMTKIYEIVELGTEDSPGKAIRVK